MLQAVVLCQVERAKEAMLNQLYSSIRYVSSEFGKQFLVSLTRYVFILWRVGWCSSLILPCLWQFPCYGKN